jgi:hypothetical protein
MNIWLYILKYSAATFSGVYGLYATFTEFHEKKHGKSVLTRRGRIGIALLLVATLISLSSDAYKDRIEHAKAKDEEAKRDEMLMNLRRESTPLNLDHLTGSVSISFPVNSKFVAPYLRRVKALRGPRDQADYFQQRDPGFPKQNNPSESDLFSFVASMGTDIDIVKASQQPTKETITKTVKKTDEDSADEQSSDLSVTLRCYDRKNLKQINSYMDVWWGNPFDGSTNRDAYRMTVECNTDNASVTNNVGTIRSFLDLAGATVNVHVSSSLIVTPGPTPETVTLRTNDGRTIQFANFTHSKTCANGCFTTTMPSDFK